MPLRCHTLFAAGYGFRTPLLSLLLRAITSPFVFTSHISLIRRLDWSLGASAIDGSATTWCCRDMAGHFRHSHYCISHYCLLITDTPLSSILPLAISLLPLSLRFVIFVLAAAITPLRHCHYWSLIWYAQLLLLLPLTLATLLAAMLSPLDCHAITMPLADTRWYALPLSYW